MSRSFDGVNDSIDFGDITFLDSATAVTASVWVYLNDFSTDRVVIEKGQISTDTHFLFADVTAFTSGRTNVWNGRFAANGNTYVIEGATNSAVTGQWQHLALTFAANNVNGVALHVDGTEDANSPISTSGTTSLDADHGDANSLMVGERTTGSMDMNGRIAELAYWDVVLSDAEIASLAKGVPATRIRRDNMLFYAPLGYGATEPTYHDGGGITGTVAGATVADHPPVSPGFGFDYDGLPYEVSSSSYTLAVDSGSYTLTGQDATLTATGLSDGGGLMLLGVG